MKSVLKARSMLALGLLALAGSVTADEEPIPLKDVPRAVLDAVKTRLPGAELKEAAKETEDGKTTFEIALKDKGRNVDVALSAAGKILEIETEVSPEDLPRAVTSAIATKYPKATIKKAEEIVEFEEGEEAKSFEVLLDNGAKKTLEVKLSPAGKILNTEDNDED
jgi:hypothetical protein